jgi:amino acid permease
MVLRVPIFVLMLSRRSMPRMWHASMSLGHRPVGSFILIVVLIWFKISAFADGGQVHLKIGLNKLFTGKRQARRETLIARHLPVALGDYLYLYIFVVYYPKKFLCWGHDRISRYEDK